MFIIIGLLHHKGAVFARGRTISPLSPLTVFYKIPLSFQALLSYDLRKKAEGKTIWLP